MRNQRLRRLQMRKETHFQCRELLKGKFVFYAKDIPKHGYKVFYYAEGNEETQDPAWDGHLKTDFTM